MRQAETVEKLMAAGLEELREVGHEALTIRSVAHRANVSPATAYTYLASKNHLFAELFLRRLLDEPEADASAADPVARVSACTRTTGSADEVSVSGSSRRRRRKSSANRWFFDAR